MRTLPLVLVSLMAAAAADPGVELLNAAKKGETQRVKLLLGAKAPIGARDKEGRTALMLAASHGHTATVELLLDRGANPEERDKEGFDAYALALFSSAGGREGVMKLLPQPPRFRVTVEPELSTDNLYNSCSMPPQQLAKLVAGLRVENMVGSAVRDASVAPGAGPLELVSYDADAIAQLRVRPRTSCLQHESVDDVSLEIDLKLVGKDGATLLMEKTFGARLKGLLTPGWTRRATSPTQYQALFGEMARAHGPEIYWAVMGALLKHRSLTAAAR
jgi:hypothetical protein